MLHAGLPHATDEPTTMRTHAPHATSEELTDVAHLGAQVVLGHRLLAPEWSNAAKMATWAASS